MITFTVSGMPFGKKRPRASSFGGHARIHNDPENERYELKVLNAYLMSQGLKEAPKEPLCKEGEYVYVDIYALFPMPKAFSKKKRQQALEGWVFPDKKPDVDNISKAILDALNGVAYHDDSQVIRLIVTKRYIDDEPRVVVVIAKYEAEWRK